jgi:hypothetical protein
VIRNLRMAAAPFPRGLDEHEARSQQIAATPSTATDITIGGHSERFTRWDDNGTWYAAAQYAGHSVVIEARVVTAGEVTLARVTDIEPYLAGRRAYLRTLRNET